jgi:glycosyltransferase involved in cell wall biosynthesis
MKIKLLSVVVPCYNESKTIEKLLSLVEKSDIGVIKKEIIVVDDGSKDGTREILEKYKKKKGYKVIFHGKNQGKGGAIKTGFLKSTGEVVVVQDADLEYDPNEYNLLLAPILEDKADVVYGSRFMGGRPHRVVYYWHSVMNKALTTFSNMLTNINLTDMETCYKVFKGEIIRELSLKLESKRFGIEPEITARLAKIKGIRFYEVGISYYGRTYEEGKKINWKDGIRAVWEIIKYNVA